MEEIEHGLGKERAGMEKERRAGRGRPKNTLSFVFCTRFVLSFTSPLSSGLRRKRTTKPHRDGVVVRRLLQMTPDGNTIRENHVQSLCKSLREKVRAQPPKKYHELLLPICNPSLPSCGQQCAGGSISSITRLPARY